MNGYVSPNDMVKCLAVLTRLKDLSISINKKISRSDESRSHPHPQMRAILPALTRLEYEGRSEYLEDLLARIDMPQIDFVMIQYSKHQIKVSQLSHFIKRTETLKIDQFTRTQLYFYTTDSFFGLSRSEEAWTESHLNLRRLGGESLEVQVRDMTRLIGQISAMFSNVDDPHDI